MERKKVKERIMRLHRKANGFMIKHNEKDPVLLPFAGDFYTHGKHSIIPRPRGTQQELLKSLS